MESESNRQYFNSEAGKNRDQWKHSDGDRILRVRNAPNPNRYANGKFDDVIRYEQPDWIWKKAEGDATEYEDEDSVEYENEEDAFADEEFAPDELPKFRQLVRMKKLELKAQYGKAHLKSWTTSERKCLGGWVDVKGDGKGPIWKSDINCTTINIPHVAWVWGWRKKWREFKQQGGLAQLKMISKGLAPMPTPTVPDTTSTTPVTTTPSGSGKGASRSVGDTNIVDVGDDSVGGSGSGIGKLVVGVIVTLAIGTGLLMYINKNKGK